ncbi:MAG: beta-galactosidase [Candidatus Omnitrophota bacterium]
MKMGRRSTIFLTVLILFAITVKAEALKLGTTYSPLQCQYLGLDWKKTYLNILDAGYDVVRIGAYWSEIEKKENFYDFSELEWQIQEAKAKGIPIVLTVGMKAPRWPEFFIPEWILKKANLGIGADVSKNVLVRNQTLAFIKKVVEKYKHRDIIQYWQVENEALNHIGCKYWYIGMDFLKEEVALVRKIDERNRPIILTSATYPNKFLRFIATLFDYHNPIKEYIKMADIVGINVYPIVGCKILFKNFSFETTLNEREKYFSPLIKSIHAHNREVWVTELQAEPWEPGHLVYTKEQQPKTASTDITRELFKEMDELGVDTILLWGAEYWQFRAEEYDETQWVEMNSELLKIRDKEITIQKEEK